MLIIIMYYCGMNSQYNVPYVGPVRGTGRNMNEHE